LELRQRQVICCGIVKCLLIAYFIGNISAQKISKSIHVRQSYSKPKVGRFFETRCILFKLKHKVTPPSDKSTARFFAHEINRGYWILLLTSLRQLRQSA